MIAGGPRKKPEPVVPRTAAFAAFQSLKHAELVVADLASGRPLRSEDVTVLEAVVARIGRLISQLRS